MKYDRSLLEREAIPPALKIDEEKGIIYRVRICGRFSRNDYGLKEAENGTEYSLDCLEDSIPMYEDSTVRINHPGEDEKPSVSRDAYDAFGKLKNVVVEQDAMWGDLHYIKTHEFAPRVISDIRQRLGVYGLSHNARSSHEHFDKANKRLVIDKIVKVRGVDLVDRPATNRNLWESHRETTVPTEKKVIRISLRNLLESAKKRFSAGRYGFARRLLEDDTMSEPVGAEAAVMEDAPVTEPDDALHDGFRAAILAILDQYKDGKVEANDAAKQIKKLLSTHENLTSDEEPSPVDDLEEEEDMEEDEKPAKKAKGGKDVEESQKELRALRKKDKVRDLAESMKVTLSSSAVKAACALDGSELETFIREQAGTRHRAPRSGPASNPRREREVKESWNTEDEMNALRN